MLKFAAAFLAAVTFADARIMWCGNVTATSLTVAVEMKAAESATGVVVAKSPSLSSGVVATGAVSGAGVVKVDAVGLDEGTMYYYGVPGLTDVGQCRTFKSGAFSHKIVTASCAFTGSNKAIFDEMRGEAADIFVHMGDLHYEDNNENVTAMQFAAYQHVFSNSRQAALFRSSASAYMWDDHDFGANNADGFTPSRMASRTTYDSTVPHYPLRTTQVGVGPIYQAFTVGRVRYIITDLRSWTDLEPGSIMGVEQREWFYGELANHASYSLMIWFSTKPWQGTYAPDSDKWRGYPVERRNISDKIASLGITNLIMVAGDAHLLAMDDGRNNDYSTYGGAGFPLCQSAPMDQYGSDKQTGPYSHGYFGFKWWITNHYTTLFVTDDGTDPVSLHIQGYQWSGTGGKKKLIDAVLTAPFVRNGTSVEKFGSHVNLPWVPFFVYESLGFLVLSPVLYVVITLSWWAWHWHHTKKMAALHGGKRRLGLTSPGHSSVVREGSDETLVQPPQTATAGPDRNGTVSINPMMVANGAAAVNAGGSKAPKQMLLVLEPLPGDPFAAPVAPAPTNPTKT